MCRKHKVETFSIEQCSGLKSGPPKDRSMFLSLGPMNITLCSKGVSIA